MDIEYHGGTADAFFPFICDRWGLEIERIHSSYEAFERCKNGDFVVMVAGAGLWTSAGHFILAVGTRGDEIQIYDPYLYAGKFDTSSRRGAGVSVEGSSCYVQIDKFKQYSNIQRLWAINIGAQVQPEPNPRPTGGRSIGDTVTINGVYTSSSSTNRLNPIVKTGTITYISEGALNPYLLNNGDIGWTNDNCILGGGAPQPVPPTPSLNVGTVRVNSSLNVRSGPSTSYGRVGSLYNGNTVTIYEEQNGWYRIGDNKWVSSDYVAITGNTPQQSNRIAVVTAKSGLNVRSGPSTSYSRVGGLANGTSVTIYEEQNGWAKIGEGQWVSEDYLSFNGNTSTVGQTRKFATTTTLYANANLTGTTYVYKSNVAVIIKENVNSDVDKIYVPATGRTAYCRNNVYR